MGGGVHIDRSVAPAVIGGLCGDGALLEYMRQHNK